MRPHELLDLLEDVQTALLWDTHGYSREALIEDLDEAIKDLERTVGY